MGWNGSGNFQRTNGSFSGSEVWQDDANAGYDIVESRHDSHDQDLAQGINNCLTKDGQNSPTANLSMNSFKHTNVGDGTARNQYATVGQVQDQAVQALSLVGGTANAITASMTPTILSYNTGARYYFKAANNNSGATTLKIDSAPAVTIQYNGAALVGGEIVSGRYFTVIYDGSNFQLLNPANAATPLWGATTAGTSTAYTITPAPAITAYAAGQRFSFIAHVANGASPTLAVSGLSTKAIQYQGTALIGAEMALNMQHEVMYDGTAFQLLNPATNAGSRLAPVRASQIQDSSVVYGGTSTGSANAQAISLSPDITAYTVGQRFIFKAGFTNTGATTLAVDSISPAVAVQRFGAALVGGEIKLNDMVEVVYDGTAFQLENSTPAPLFVDRTNNRVGVGTTAPTADLHTHMATAATNAVMKVSNAATGAGTLDGFDIVVDSASIAYLIQRENADLVFRTNNLDRGRLDANGILVVGATSAPFAPSSKIAAVSGATGAIDAVINATGLGVPAVRFSKFDNNNGTSNVFAIFYINNGGTASGTITANGANQATFTSTSDERLKENVVDLPSQLANIMALRPVEFDYKDGSGHQIGFIAQEVEAVYPDLVGTSPDGFLTLSGLGKNESRMIKAFQEFAKLTQNTIAALEDRIEALEA